MRVFSRVWLQISCAFVGLLLLMLMLFGYFQSQEVAALAQEITDDSRWARFVSLLALSVVLIGVVTGGLAWYVTLPIRQLHRASEPVPLGRVRSMASASIGLRNDEIADLAHRLDTSATGKDGASPIHEALLRDSSHDLRSPLTRLTLAANLLKDASGDNRTRLEGQLREDLNELEMLIDEVIVAGQLARLESREISLDLETADVVQTLTPVIDAARFEAEVANKSVRIIVADQPMRAIVDSINLKRAVANVIRNAIRHSCDLSEVVLSIRPERGDIVIAIEDQAEGLTNPELQRVKMPYFRRDKAGVRFIGTGVGLALADRIAQAHRGTLQVTRSPRGGLLVRFAIPAVKPVFA